MKTARRERGPGLPLLGGRLTPPLRPHSEASSLRQPQTTRRLLTRSEAPSRPREQRRTSQLSPAEEVSSRPCNDTCLPARLSQPLLPRLGCRRPAEGETLTAAECLAPPRPKVCRSALLEASVLDMVARPPLNLAVMVAGRGLGSWAQAPERSETEPLEGQWPDQAGLAGGLDLPASESAKSSDNHSNSLPPPLLLEVSLRQC